MNNENTDMKIEQLKRNILISGSYQRGFINCGMKVIEIVEFHYRNLPAEFILALESMFTEQKL